MKHRTRSGQTTVEFALVFAAFALLVFGLIEVGRALYEKQALARAAETMVQALAQAAPSTTTTSNLAFWTSVVPPLVDQANQNAALGLNRTWTAPVTVIAGYYNASSGMCVSSGGDPNQPCESAPNVDGHVVIIGFPDLSVPKQLAVTVTVPYQSYIGYPLQLLGGLARETVTAYTRCGQYPQEKDCP